MVCVWEGVCVCGRVCVGLCVRVIYNEGVCGGGCVCGREIARVKCTILQCNHRYRHFYMLYYMCVCTNVSLLYRYIAETIQVYIHVHT